MVDAGYLVATVLDIVHNEKDIAILDASASCHMPDVLEVPYTPPLFGAAEPGVHPHTYILGGKTCMTGDIIGEYSFLEPLKTGRPARLRRHDPVQLREEQYLQRHAFARPRPAARRRPLRGRAAVRVRRLQRPTWLISVYVVSYSIIDKFTRTMTYDYEEDCHANR